MGALLGGLFLSEEEEGWHAAPSARRAVGPLVVLATPAFATGVPGALARLSTSPEAVSLGEADLRAAGVSVPEMSPGSDAELRGFGIDFTDGFYQFRFEQIASYSH